MITADTLVLYYGDELDDAERSEVTATLERDAALAERYARLVADLDRLHDAAAPSAPELATTRWHKALTDAAANDVASRPARRAPVYAVAAGLGLLAIGIAIGIRLGDTPTPTPQVAEAPAPQPASDPIERTPEPVFARGLADYMQTARVQLVALDPADATGREAIIDGIIAHNRAFELAAEERGADDIARVLRAFEQVLHQLAQESATTDDVRRNVDQLSFEYGAMLTRIAPRTSNQPQTL